MPVAKIRCIRASVNLHPRLFHEISPGGADHIPSRRRIEIAVREGSIAVAPHPCGGSISPRPMRPSTVDPLADDRPPCRSAVALRSLEWRAEDPLDRDLMRI